MTCSSTFQATTAGTFTALNFNPTNTAISASNTISLIISLANTISSSSYLSVGYTPDLRISFSYSNSNQQTTQVAVASGVSDTLLIGNLTNSTSLVSTLFMGSFTITNPPYASLPNPVVFFT